MKKKISLLIAALVLSLGCFAYSQQGLVIGGSYSINSVANSFKAKYGNKCDVQASSSNSFANITIYANVTSQEGFTFGRCTIYFYGSYVWKVVYAKPVTSKSEIGNKLEYKYGDYSVSDSEYKYQYGDTEIYFDGSELRCVSDNITWKVLYGL